MKELVLKSEIPVCSRKMRWPYLVLAYTCTGLAAMGIFIPGLPTTPFLLVAAWAATRGSSRLHRWLYDNRYSGSLLRDWEGQKAVSVRAKISAIALLVISWLVLAWYTDGLLVPLLTGMLFVVVAVFLLTRPTPRSGSTSDDCIF